MHRIVLENIGSNYDLALNLKKIAGFNYALEMVDGESLPKVKKGEIGIVLNEGSEGEGFLLANKKEFAKKTSGWYFISRRTGELEKAKMKGGVLTDTGGGVSFEHNIYHFINCIVRDLGGIRKSLKA